MYWKKAVGVAMAGALSLSLAACGSTSTPSSQSKPAAKAETPAQLIGSLPSTLQALYQHNTDPVQASAYSSFKPVKGPWKICFADSYEGNPWRVTVKNDLQAMATMFGSKVSSLQVAVANNDITQQISQIEQFANSGCSVILTIPASSTGLNGAIQAAYQKGVPVVSFAGAVTSPYAINVDSNYYLWGENMAEGIASALHGHGNVLMVEGIAGQPITQQEDEGGLAGFANYPGIKVVSQVNGDWTPSVTQSVVLNVLTTNPAPINGVWTTGSETEEVASDFAQVHRPLPVISASISGDALGYWHAHQSTFKFYGGAVLPDWTAQTAFRIAVRLLEGQHPKLDTLLVPIPTVTQASLANWYQSCMTPSSASIFPTSQTDPLPESLMNGYFTNGQATPQYSFASMPKACQ